LAKAGLHALRAWGRKRPVGKVIFAAALFAITHASADCAAWPGYQPQLFRWNEDYSAFCSRDETGLLALKCVPLGSSDYVSFGADYRFRIDAYNTDFFGLHGSRAVEALENRALAHADLHFGESARLFLQLGSGTEPDGRSRAPAIRIHSTSSRPSPT
jgi:hypothetical protein